MEAIADEGDDNDNESYTGSHSSKDTVLLRADSILSEEWEELQESETQGIIKVFHVACNLNQTYLFDDDPL